LASEANYRFEVVSADCRLDMKALLQNVAPLTAAIVALLAAIASPGRTFIAFV
jgi:hypothetical protein